MRVREKTLKDIASAEADLAFYEGLGSDYSDKIASISARISRLQENLRHYDQESADGLKKPARWRWRKTKAND